MPTARRQHKSLPCVKGGATNGQRDWENLAETTPQSACRLTAPPYTGAPLWVLHQWEYKAEKGLTIKGFAIRKAFCADKIYLLIELCCSNIIFNAPVMELVDMRDLGSRAERRGGSSPFRRTTAPEYMCVRAFTY